MIGNWACFKDWIDILANVPIQIFDCHQFKMLGALLIFAVLNFIKII